ncbi:hypothetical protein OH458_01360 [Vibrio sp. MarTm2]|uniref:hypothetical protein n=1 Tax=Vibrio sp. MarTm2 TaxID=2998831 RepID=UPI0022CD8BD1|nr:hypothetical protein [Vibrio sp. MarTm2]MDA0126728.1 hypothetical protein [Vibrio sp. MarTm2]
MKKNSILLIVMFLFLVLYPDFKQKAFIDNKAQNEYIEYYDKMMLEGSFSEEQFQEFKMRSDEYEEHENSYLSKGVVFATLLSFLYYTVFLSLAFFFFKARDYVSFALAVIMTFSLMLL